MEKKGIIKQWLSFLLAFLLGIQGGLPTLSIFATSGNASVVTGRSTTTSTFNMEWTSPVDGINLTYSTDKQTCILTPESNTNSTNTVAPASGTSAQCTLNFSLGGNKQAEVGEIQIRMPRYVFENRDGVPQGDINLGISNKQEGTTGFYYYVDTKEDEDLKNDEIVITNFKAIDSAYVFTCAVRYFTTGGGKYLSEIKDQYTKTFHATLNVQLAGEEKRVLDSNSLTIQHRTSADLTWLYKYDNNKYEKWQTSWGAMPEDSKESDYFYVVWRVQSYSSGTQPFTLTLNDTLQDTYGGQIIGCGSSSSSIKLGDEGKKAFQIDKKIPSNSWDYWYVLVKYPRTIVDPLPAKMPVLLNKGEVTLTGVDGVTVTKSATADYTYVDDSFKAPGTTYSQSKSGPSTSSGYLDKLDLTKDGEVIPDNSSYNWYIGTDVRGYAWTLQEGGDKKDPTHYGKQPYEIEVIDDIVMLEGERLEKEDYQFRSFYIDSFYEYDYIQNEATGKWETKSNTKYEEWFPITIYYQSGQGSEWKPMVTLYRDNTGYYYELDTKEKVYVTSSKQFQLPSDTTGVKAIHQSKSYSSYFSLNLKIDLKKSERIKRLREGKDSIRIYNASSLRIYDAAHNCVNKRNDITATTSSYYPGLYNEVKKQDDTLYGAGNYPYHTQAYTDLTPYQRSSTMTKKVDATANNVVQGRVEIKYNIDMKQSIYSSVETAKELREVGVFQEEKEGVFYDLLPRGMFVDKGSIKIHRQRAWYGAPSYDSYYDKEYGAIVSVDWKENWKNTGRTMMIVHMKVPDGKNNYYEVGNSLYSGWHLWYTAYYPWESVVDYGNTLNNSVAYKSPQGPLFGGYPDDGGTIVDKADMVDLDEDGNPQGTLKDTLYAEKKDVLALDTAADLSFSKSVKASTDENYKKDTVTVGGSDYSYRLRIASQKYTETGNIILYDVLEQYDPTNTNRWEGGLKGIDLSSPIVKGIDVKVYYATKQNVMANVEQFRDLTNTEIWSAQAPSDLSKVTALAFDLRKKTDGKDYVMMPEEAMSIVLSMKSPIIKVREYETAQAEAFNSCWYSGYTKDQVSKIVTDRWLESPSTSVKITSPKIEVVKSATPTSGTEQVPQTVEVDGQIVYNIGVVSKEDAVGFDQVEAEDIIPAGLSVDLSQLKWYIGTDEKNAELVQTSKDVAVTQDPNNPNKLTFIIKRLSPNTEVHFLVPTKVEAVKRSISFKNTASLTKIQGEPYVVTSGTTYHNAVEKRNITVKKVWEDANNQDGKRPEEVTITLVKNRIETQETQVLNKANGWTGAFTNLPVYEAGNKIVYEIREQEVTNYQTKITGNVETGFIVTNQHTPEQITIRGTKIWNDASNQDGKRPSEITVQLLKDGNVVKEQVLQADNFQNMDKWEYVFTDVPKYENGKEIQYTVSEKVVPNEYTSSVDGYVITNRHDSEQMTIPVENIWNDGNNQYGKRPQTVSVQLLADGEKVGTEYILEDGNEWKDVFTNLPKYKNGVEIQYTIQVQDIEGYYVVVEGDMSKGFKIIDTPFTTISGTKVWDDANNQDGIRPSTITIDLYGNGKIVDHQVVSGTALNVWEWKFEDKLQFENNKEIIYTVIEHSVENYQSSVEGYNITNHYTPDKINIPVVKQWDDANNQDGVRPSSVTMKLYANGEDTGKVQVLEESNRWSGNFTELDKYKDGKEILYTVEEEVVDSYTATVSGSAITGYQVINVHKPEMIVITGSSIWNDQENRDKKRPNQVTIELFANGVYIDSQVVSLLNGEWSFGERPKYADGKEIIYTIKQSDIPSYITTILGNQVQGFIIQNDYVPVIIPEFPIVGVPIPLLPQIDTPLVIESKPEKPVVNVPKEEKPIEVKPTKPTKPVKQIVESTKPTDSNYHVNSNSSSKMEMEKEKDKLDHGVSNGQGKLEGIKEQARKKKAVSDNNIEKGSNIHKGNLLSSFQEKLPKTSDQAKIIIWSITILISLVITIHQLIRRFYK